MKKSIKSMIDKLIKTGFIHIFGASSLNQVLSLLSGIVLVRVLSKSDYGVFSYAFNIYQFFLICSGMGIVSGILQMCSEFSDKPDISDSIYQWSSGFGIRVNIVMAFILFMVALFVSFPIKGTNELLAVFCALPLCTIMYEMGIAKLRSEIRAKEYSYSNIICTLLYCAFSIGGAFIYGSIGLIIGRYFAYIISIYLLYKLFHVRQVMRAPKLEKQLRASLLKVSFVSVINNGLSTVFGLIEVFILGLVIVDSTVTASYKVATTIPMALNFVPLAFAVYVYPYFAKHIGKAEWLQKKTSLCLGGLWLINTGISVVLIACAEPLIRLVFGAQYLDCVPMFRLLMVGYCIGGTFRTLPGNLLVSQRKLLYNTVVAVVGCLISIIANVVLIPKAGSIGAAWAHVIVLIVTALLNTIGLFHFIHKDACKVGSV